MRNAQEKWNLIAAEYDNKIIRGDFFRKTILDVAIIKHIGTVRGASILDVGCGNGYMSHELSLRGARVTGMDISEKLIALANTRYADGEFVVADVEKQFPFSDNQFDLVFSNMVFMDIENPEITTQEIVRTAKPNAKLVISILHPIFTSGNIYKTIKELFLFKQPSFLLRRYKKESELQWKLPDVTQPTTVFHRPMEYYINLLARHGIVIKSIEECTLPEIHKENGFQKTIHEIPMFLVIEGIINK